MMSRVYRLVIEPSVFLSLCLLLLQSSHGWLWMAGRQDETIKQPKILDLCTDDVCATFGMNVVHRD
jgi:hypothetical protein